MRRSIVGGIMITMVFIGILAYGLAIAESKEGKVLFTIFWFSLVGIIIGNINSKY